MDASGRIVTFYSYKGGTGRSMALANFAWILAAGGKHVLVIDWDLEAPGLHRYFRPFLVDPDLFETDGLIDTFWSLAASAVASAPADEKQRLALSGGPEVADALDDAARRLTWQFPLDGYIDFIGAGRQGATYSERVNTFDWKRFYELGGACMLSAARERLRARYHYVLIDSRTGVSDTSGICTMQLPSDVVAAFTLNRQSIDGVAAVLRSIRAFRSATVDGSKIGLYPLATRIENAEQGRLELARGYARGLLEEFLPTTMLSRTREYWDRMEIAYRPAYAFEEVLAAFGDATGATGAADTMASQIESMTQCVTGNADLRMPEIVESDRADVLAKYAFGVLEVPAVKTARTVDEDAEDTEFLRGVRAKEQQWRSSKFAWRYLLSRRELELLTGPDRRTFGRNMAYYIENSESMQQYARRLDLAFGTSLAVALAAAGGAYAALALRHVAFALPGAIVAFPVLWMCLALVLNLGSGSPQARERPYGITLLDGTRLTLLGPFRRPILDYDPRKDRISTRARSPSASA